FDDVAIERSANGDHIGRIPRQRAAYCQPSRGGQRWIAWAALNVAGAKVEIGDGCRVVGQTREQLAAVRVSILGSGAELRKVGRRMIVPTQAQSRFEV